jgi:CheY-like chemotaxis protein
MGKASILVVDDEKIVLDGWREELELAGYRVRTAQNGSEALTLAKEEKPDIVLTDLVMPGINGVEVCKGIKEMYPDVDVLFISGHPIELEKHLIDFLNAGGREEYLRKPLLENELIEALERTLRQRGNK